MKLIFKFIIVYLFWLITFCGIIIGVHTIPSSWIEDNIVSSAELLEQEGAYKQIWNFKLFQLDNFTDACMLNMALAADSDHPVMAAMRNEIVSDGNCFNMAKNTIMLSKADTASLERKVYGRYWQGHQVFIRPLLTFTDYNGIRIINFVLLFGLFIYCVYLLIMKVGMVEAALFALAMVAINFFIVPLSMQFSTCFYIALTAMAIVLKYPKLIEKTEDAAILFFSIGAICVFFDFLTCPQLTLGLPLIVMLLTRRTKSVVAMLLVCCMAWGAGYALIWASKWFLGYLLTDYNLLADALNQVGVRTTGLYKGMELTFINMFNFVWSNIAVRGLQWIVYVILILVFCLAGIYSHYQKGIKRQRKYLWLVMIMMIVPVWYMVLKEHSVQHGWFTWRALLLSLYAFMLWMYYTVREEKHIENE